MVSTFIELVSEVMTSFRERLKNTFLSAFVISFIISNWQAILYLIYSDSSIEVKIECVQIEYTSLSTLLIYPLSYTLFYVIGLPYVMLGIERLSNSGIEARKKSKHTNDLEELSRLKIKAQKEYEIEQEKSGTKEQSELRSEIETLKNELSVTKEELESIRNEKIVEQEKRQELEKRLQNTTEPLSLATNRPTDSRIRRKPYRTHDIQLSEKEQERFIEEYNRVVNSRNDLIDGYELLENVVNHYEIIYDSFSDDLVKDYVDLGLIKIIHDDKAEFTAKGKFFWKLYIEGKGFK